MGVIERILARVAPQMALSREIAGIKLQMLKSRRAEMFGSHYLPTGGSDRAKDFRRQRSDAVEAARGSRAMLSFIGRDMLRNNPRVNRANNLIVNATVGGGIIPTVRMRSDEDKRSKDIIEGLIKDHLCSTAIDSEGRSNIYGLQALSLGTIPISGEVLMRRRLRRASDGLPLPFQIQLLETDFLDQWRTASERSGVTIDQGVEYSPLGREQAFWLHRQHPGSRWQGGESVRVPAEHVVLSFLPQRPGQRRGVSWYAPVMTQLHELQKFLDATLKRQEVAAMFAGIMETEQAVGMDGAAPRELPELQAATIMEIGRDESLTFNDPPSADSAEPIMRLIDRTIAAGLMISYEGFSGDYSNVNFSSGRMARIDTDPTVTRWQRHLLIDQQMSRIGAWTKEAIAMVRGIDPDSYVIEWTPPQRPMVDPTKEIPALIKQIGAGLQSRRGIIRQQGGDPNAIEQEIDAEANWAADRSLRFVGSAHEERKTTE